jgi:hypothetical protein
MATEQASVSVEAATRAPVRERWTQGSVCLALTAACVAVLAVQALLIRRINVNWDEFWFLTHIHALQRGELSITFQMAYTHLFTWLTSVGDEMAQVTVGRACMFVLFVISAGLLFRLASRWASRPAAIVAVLCFLAASPVLRHGASFRTDSLMLPLLLGTLLLVTLPRPTRRSDVLVGVLFGVALAASVKAALFVPLLAVIALTGASSEGESLLLRLQVAMKRWLVPAATAVAVFTAIFLLHRWSLAVQPSEDAATYASDVARKSLFDVPLFARWHFFRATLGADLMTWCLIGIGIVAAVARRKWQVAACALALLPIALYRNSFPYFYVVMLAPAAVLAAVAVDEIRAFANRRAAAPREWLPLALAVPLMLQALVHAAILGVDRQAGQREVIAVVHRMFPQPVPYFDHSGMIASFPKVNFFMSSWGMEVYRERGQGFVREAIRKHRPPLLLANRGEIDPHAQALLPEDQALIDRFYLQYWGPIWVAGGHAEVPVEGEVVVALPFPGRYRVFSSHPVLIDGVLRDRGDEVEIRGEEFRMARPPDASVSAPYPAALVWAVAQTPPATAPNFNQLYQGL